MRDLSDDALTGDMTFPLTLGDYYPLSTLAILRPMHLMRAIPRPLSAVGLPEFGRNAMVQ